MTTRAPRLGAAVAALAAFASAQQSAARPPGGDDPARAFFAAGEIVRIRIDLGAAARDALRATPREYVPAEVRCDDAPWAGAGVKLKGAAGSFRELDDRPGFTLHLGKFGGTGTLHGLRRFHLNNGVQDDSRLCEWLGSTVFAAAGLPAARVAHARVWLDGRDLGLYVLREAYDRQFLMRAFGDDRGNLYDGGFCQDVDAELEKDAGSGADDRADLRALAALASAFDHTEPARRAAFAAAVAIEPFVDFCALEALLGHWDGYCRTRNNYRLWIGGDGVARFLPHGMDQLLGEADASVLAHPPALVASALLQCPEWRKLYRERLRALSPLLKPDRLLPRLRTLGMRLQRELADDQAAATALGAAIFDLEGRLRARYDDLQKQVRAPEPEPLALVPGKPQPLRRWLPAAETDGVVLGKKDHLGKAAWTIASDGRDGDERSAAFRTTVLLAKGRYRLRALAAARGVIAPPAGDGGEVRGGVRLAVDDARSERLFGDSGWTALACEFEVAEFRREVELQAALHARGGTAWFRVDSLQIERLPE